ncbi:hypothetical protein ACFC0M_16675 [Streptomyces sp. NPDC056149]|uniref:hypothetical protein n=1 Tax=unclassified Streptomyces TaxID=2593676 RepID=UPI0023810F4A|nr:hypothetical protein [Streptomyces sp. WZ-12]
MTATAEIRWAQKEDERWAAAFELHFITKFHPPKGLANQVLSEVYEAVTETGQPAGDLFGEPRQYAACVAADRIDETHASKRNVDGTTPGERLTGTVVAAGFVAMTVSVVYWVRGGLWADVSAASLVGVGALATCAVVLCLVEALRAAGRVQAALVCGGAAVAMVAAGFAAFTMLPRHVLFSLPMPVLVAASAAVMVGAYRLPDATADTWFTRQRAEDDAQWLRQLDGLLRGRHSLPARQAGEHVAEARSHLASAPDLTAQEEFGDVETYAARLAGGPRRTKWTERHKAYLAGAFAAAVAVANFDVLRTADVTSFGFWCAAVAVAFSLGYAAVRFRDCRQQRQLSHFFRQR